MTDKLSAVREGMAVRDRTGAHIGTVDFVRLSDEAGDTPHPTASAEVDRSQAPFIAAVADAFTVDKVPEVLRQRLLRTGFLRLDADGLFASDRYIMPEQIEAVDDEVRLAVGKDELIRRS